MTWCQRAACCIVDRLRQSVPDSSLPTHSQRHLFERLRFVSQPSQAMLRAKAAHITRQSSRSRGRSERPGGHQHAHQQPPYAPQCGDLGPCFGLGPGPHHPRPCGRSSGQSSGQPGTPVLVNNHHPHHTQEDSLSSLPADSTGAVELCNFKYQRANGSASANGSHNGIQIQEQI